MPKRKLTPLILWIKKAKLVKWTKGFSCSDVEGHDVVDQLQQAIQRRKDVQIEVCAILNDTTGCLMSSAWRDNRCRIGLILGTGMTKKNSLKKWYFGFQLRFFTSFYGKWAQQNSLVESGFAKIIFALLFVWKIRDISAQLPSSPSDHFIVCECTFLSSTSMLISFKLKIL